MLIKNTYTIMTGMKKITVKIVIFPFQSYSKRNLVGRQFNMLIKNVYKIIG